MTPHELQTNYERVFETLLRERRLRCLDFRDKQGSMLTEIDLAMESLTAIHDAAKLAMSKQNMAVVG